MKQYRAHWLLLPRQYSKGLYCRFPASDVDVFFELNRCDRAVSTRAGSMDSVFPEARKTLLEADAEVAGLVEEEKRRQW